MLRTVLFKRSLFVAAALFMAALGASAELKVEVGQLRAVASIHDLTDAAVRRHARQTALLGRRSFELRTATGRMQTPFTLPLRVVLTRNGVPIEPPTSKQSGGTDINPVFDSTGPRVFPSGYKTLLESVFTQARSTMNVVFGQPAIGGDVRVRNYDADIQDRYAVAGAYYIPNGPDGPEIRFPVYNSALSAAIHYVHCLLLAYQGLNPYPFDAVEEGIVRAATMRVVRTPGSLPDSPTQADIETVLDSSYDVSAFYDWYNQPALSCRDFIAPNLLNTNLPAGGSTGGIFLVRYMMAGTAWSKVATEYPAFFSTFNGQYYASPGSFQTMPALIALAQSVIDTLAGGTGTIEGRSFANWANRQYILDVQINAGLKVMVQPFPIDATGGTSDFGVFAIESNAFRTAANGDESLLAGNSYPIYWRPDFTRFFASVQDDVIRFSGAYGSVAPNFVGTQFGGQQYRVAVDVPFQNANTRVVLPAGSYSTGSSPLTKNFFGSLIGLGTPVGGSYQVTIEWIGGSQALIPVQNFAFGHRITDASFNNAQPVTVRVFFNSGSPVELFNRRINKGVGALAVNLADPSSDTTFSASVPAQLFLGGVPLQPYRVRPTEAFGTNENDMLFARWNPTLVRYELFPDIGQVMEGQGNFLRLPTLTNIVVDGYRPPKTPLSVALQPGWNIVTVPTSMTLGTTNLSFTVATEALSTFAQAQGTIIGNTIFEFLPDGGNPDTGTMVPTTVFEPGKGYMVRALRPEGAVMVFTPTDFAFNGGGGGPSNPFAATGPQSSASRRSRGRDWESLIEVQNSTGRSTSVIIGQSVNTTRGFDPFLDTELPPSPGGFQAAIISSRPMYKEIGVYGDNERHLLRITGLRPGERLELHYIEMFGDEDVTIYDPSTRRTYRLRERNSLRFTATRTVQTFEIIIGSSR